MPDLNASRGDGSLNWICIRYQIVLMTSCCIVMVGVFRGLTR